MILLSGVGVDVDALVAGRASTKTLLDDLTVTLDEPRVAVIGANGSGKSTLLRLLNGLALPTRGTVTVDELDTARHGPAVRRIVGFVFTDPAHQLVMQTPADDVELGLRRSITDASERRATARAALANLGLGAVADQSVHDLSGGERQLVALTGVLAMRPRVVVADEPTTLLDLRNRDRICAALLTLPQQLVYATHDLEFAAAADRCLVVHEGRLLYDGQPAGAIDAYRRALA